MINKAGAIIVVLLIVCFLAYNVITKVQHKKSIENSTQTIPDFSAKKLDGFFFSNNDLKKSTPIIFIYFNTECDFCQQEAIDIRKNISLFNKMQIIFLSSESPDQIRDFASFYALLQYENVIFLNDINKQFLNQFDISMIPCVLVYDKNQKFIKRYTGLIKMEAIVREQ